MICPPIHTFEPVVVGKKPRSFWILRGSESVQPKVHPFLHTSGCPARIHYTRRARRLPQWAILTNFFFPKRKTVGLGVRLHPLYSGRYGLVYGFHSTACSESIYLVLVRILLVWKLQATTPRKLSLATSRDLLLGLGPRMIQIWQSHCVSHRQGLERRLRHCFSRCLRSRAKILYLLPLLVSNPLCPSFTAVCLNHSNFPRVHTSNFWLA